MIIPFETKESEDNRRAEVRRKLKETMLMSDKEVAWFLKQLGIIYEGQNGGQYQVVGSNRGCSR